MFISYVNKHYIPECILYLCLSKATLILKVYLKKKCSTSQPEEHLVQGNNFIYNFIIVSNVQCDQRSIQLLEDAYSLVYFKDEYRVNSRVTQLGAVVPQPRQIRLFSQTSLLPSFSLPISVYLSFSLSHTHTHKHSHTHRSLMLTESK